MAITRTIFAGILFGFLTTVQSQCPNGFMIHASSCYLDFNMQATWAEASLICEAYGGRLADINDVHEQNYLASFISRNTQNAYKPGIFWLGASDIETESEWVWTKGNIPVVYSNFATGEPNNANSHEHCLEFNFRDNFKWNDNNCENKFNFVCEVSTLTGGNVIG